jgi:hypothetical protein
MTNERVLRLSLSSLTTPEATNGPMWQRNWSKSERELAISFHQTASGRLIALGSRLVGFRPTNAVFRLEYAL